MKFLKSPIFWFAVVWSSVFWMWARSVGYHVGYYPFLDFIATPVEFLSLPVLIPVFMRCWSHSSTLCNFFADDFTLIFGFFVEGLILAWAMSKIYKLFRKKAEQPQSVV